MKKIPLELWIVLFIVLLSFALSGCRAAHNWRACPEVLKTELADRKTFVEEQSRYNGPINPPLSVLNAGAALAYEDVQNICTALEEETSEGN